jgi:predicted nucleic acid-binding protein
MERNRVFLDSSVIIAATLSSRGGSFYILTKWKEQMQFQINEYVVEELVCVMNKKFAGREDFQSRLFLLLGLARVELLRDSHPTAVKRLAKVVNREDAPIVASALAHSNVLLTLDKGLLDERIRSFVKAKGVAILAPREFIMRFGR